MTSILHSTFKQRDLISSLVLLFVISLSFMAPVIKFNGTSMISSNCTYHSGDLVLIISKICGRDLDHALTVASVEWKNLYNTLLALVVLSFVGLLFSFLDQRFNFQKRYYVIGRTALVFVIFVVISVSVSSTNIISDKIAHTDVDIGFYFLSLSLGTSIVGLMLLAFDCWQMYKNGEFQYL